MNQDPDGHWAWAVVNAGFAVYDGYRTYKAGKNKKQIAWAVASSFVGFGHVKKAGKLIGISRRAALREAKRKSGIPTSILLKTSSVIKNDWECYFD